MSFLNLVSNFGKWYSTINPANMTGAIDVIVIQQPDGTYLSSPFHVRFGKYGVLKAKEKIVDIEVNEAPVAIHMKLDDNGAAYFVEAVESDEEEQEIPPELATSPIPQDSPWLLMESNTIRKKRTNSCSSNSSTSSNSISRPKLEPFVVLKKKLFSENSVSVQTDVLNDDVQALNDDFVELNSSSNPLLLKSKGGRKRRRRRLFINKHSRNSSKTSLKEMVDEEEQAADGDEDDESETSNDENMFVIEVDKEDISEHTLTSNESRKNSCGSAATLRNADELDRAVTGQTPEAVSFLSSRLPDQEKLDSILEHQAELEKQEFEVETSNFKCDNLGVEIQTTRNYFSEPDLTPVMSPVGSRPPSPVLSDSELEVVQKPVGTSKPDEQRWEWGQLPTTLPNTPPVTEKASDQKAVSSIDKPKIDNAAKNQKAGETAGWGFPYLWSGRAKSERTSGKQGEGHGIYLDDLKDDDAEMLQIYVGCGRNNRESSRSMSVSSGAPVPVPNVIIDDDAESGNGPSLPMSPHSMEGPIGSHMYDEHRSSFRNILPDVDISLCGGLDGDNPTFSSILFEQSKITFDDFVLHLQRPEPNLFSSPNLVVRIGEQYYKWSAACPIIMSTILYGRTLPSDLVEVIRGSFQEPIKREGLNVSTNESNTNQAKKKHSTSWWPFARREEEEEKLETSPSKEPSTSIQIDTPAELETETIAETVMRCSRGTQYSLETVKEERKEGDSVSQPKDKFRKTLRLSNEAIQCLNLLPGMNEVQFSVTTAFQGTSRCSCHLYLWKWSDKIVISDIDGTITKSDVLGHVLPVIGKDWAQSGVADLFTKIVDNGYHIVYLSARAIGQASFTKDYLASIRQGDTNLPDGPLLLNPTSLMNAFHREVIERTPEKFKIACLNDIKSLFPDDHNPFFAGYGNRTNDVVAYTTVGIPIFRVFTINTKGELRHESQMYRTSYSDQSSIVDHIFPPRNGNETPLKPDCSPTAQLEYSNFAYWREPLFEIEGHEHKNTTNESPKAIKTKQK